MPGEELAGLVGAGAVPVGLGPQRLRVETASMALLTTAMLFSDSRPRLSFLLRRYCAAGFVSGLTARGLCL